MRKSPFNLRSALLATALAVTSVSASAADLSAFFNFDNVASGSTADSSLGSFASMIHFGNGDVVQDEDANGYTGTFHWVDASATYGNVLVQNDGTSVSASNVLWNDHQPILVMFSAPQTLASFSIQQDLSGYGNLQNSGSYMAYLDSSGHEIAGSQVYYTQGANPGLLLQNTSTFANVSAVLLSSGVSYDNMSVAAVPEPETYALFLAGLGLIGAMARRRRN